VALQLLTRLSRVESARVLAAADELGTFLELPVDARLT
jgi:hypothetical protein